MKSDNRQKFHNKFFAFCKTSVKKYLGKALKLNINTYLSKNFQFDDPNERLMLIKIY